MPSGPVAESKETADDERRVKEHGEYPDTLQREVNVCDISAVWEKKVLMPYDPPYGKWFYSQQCFDEFEEKRIW